MAIRTALWVLFVSVLFASGCSSPSNNKGKIEGTKWDNEAATVEGKEIVPGDIYLEFKKDGKLILENHATKEKHEGTYTLGSGDQVTFHFNVEVSGRKAHVETIKINGDKLTMSDTKGTIEFTRIRDDKFENTVWLNEAGDGKGKYGEMREGAMRLQFEKGGSVRFEGEKVATFGQGPGETVTIHFTVKLLDAEWQSKNMPVTEHRSFTMTDSEGNAIKFKKGN